MNDLIKQIAEQAEKYADHNFKGEHFWTEAYESKFAELIVKECMCVVEDAGGIDKYHYTRAISQHFGVE